MSKFVLKQHIVGEASFCENSEKEKKNNIAVGIEGGILIPKDEGKKAIVKLSISLGQEDERIYLLLKTITVFEIYTDSEVQFQEDEVRKECLPIALAQLRKTVTKVMEAYGRPGIDLPPFEDELI